MIVFAVTLSGCSTVITRLYMASGYSDIKGIYPATRENTKMLSYTPKIWEESKIDCILSVPFVLLDYPFSLTFDTLLLPYDLLEH